MSDIRHKFIPIPDKCRTLRSSVHYQTFRYQAQSDIADHGYRTECPPMVLTHGSSHTPPWQPAAMFNLSLFFLYVLTRVLVHIHPHVHVDVHVQDQVYVHVRVLYMFT